MDPKEAKILVGMPNYQNVMHAEVYANHLNCNTVWEQMGLDIKWAIIGRHFVHFARTQICQAAVEGDFTHIFWLDDDAVIAPDILPRFIEHDKEVVIAPYPMRRPPHEVGVLKSTTGDFHDHSSYKNFTVADLDQGLVEVDGGGTHCMLVKTSVLQHRGTVGDDTVHYPPKMRQLLADLSGAQKATINELLARLPDETMSLAEEDATNKPYFIMPEKGTEDMLHCYRLKKKGVKIWCDTDVFADHVGFAPVITRTHTEVYERDRPPTVGKTAANGDPLLQMQQGPADADGSGSTDDSPTRGVSILRQPVLDRRRTSSLI